MIWLTSGLVFSVIFIVLLKIRNVVIIPFINKKNKVATKPVSLGVAVIYFISLTLCGPVSILGVVCLLVNILVETANHLKLPNWVNKDL